MPSKEEFSANGENLANLLVTENEVVRWNVLHWAVLVVTPTGYCMCACMCAVPGGSVEVRIFHILKY